MAVHDTVLRKGGTDGGRVNVGKIIRFLLGLFAGLCGERRNNTLLIFQRRHDHIKALAVQLLYKVLQLVGGKTTHRHTAIFGDIALGQGQIEGRRRIPCVGTLSPSVQLKEVAHLIQQQTVGVTLLDGVVGVPKPAAVRPRLRGGGHGRLPHQRRGGEHGGVLGGGNGHGGGGGKFFDPCPHILRQTVLIVGHGSIGGDMGDSLVIAVSQFQPVPHRHAVAQVPKAQVITGGVRLYGFDGGNPLRKGLFRTFPDIIVDTQRINGIS